MTNLHEDVELELEHVSFPWRWVAYLFGVINLALLVFFFWSGRMALHVCYAGVY